MLNIEENLKIKNLGKYAESYEKGIRLKNEIDDIRPNYFRDIDRILYSLAYTRYLEKTQVYTYRTNDHLTRRMTHVQYVSKIARTIGRALKLNEDLIEAAALGHDLGHPPFGHVGEKILNKISLENNEGYFNHNIQSVRNLMFVENRGKGLNITIQVLDAIMCHNGEYLLDKYTKKNKSINDFFNEYELSYQSKEILSNLKPMTLEGAVVRISDMIAYLGKDIEDAIMLKKLSNEDIPKDIVKVLGSDNRSIVNTIIIDIIKNSTDQNYIQISKTVFDAMLKLKDFNYKMIYNKLYNDKELKDIEEMFRTLYNKLLLDLKSKNQKSIIYSDYYLHMDKTYQNNNSIERICLDYLSGMTDDFLINQYNNIK